MKGLHIAWYRSREVTHSKKELRYGPSIWGERVNVLRVHFKRFLTWINLTALQTPPPPQKAGSVMVHAISGRRVKTAVRMSARERCTRKKFIRLR